MSSILYFIIGLAVLVLFILGSKAIFLLAPGFTLKLILFVGAGFGCILFFMWLVPECTGASSRKEVEKNLGVFYESVETVGKSAEFDFFGDYRRNKWLKEQRKKGESGFYKDRNGLKYYNATQNKWYYQLPNGRWQDYDTWNTPIDNPFDTPVWYPITSINEITGSWAGHNKIDVSEVKNRNPAFTMIFTMFIERNDNLLDIGFKLDLNNYLEVMASKYPSYYPNKESVWVKFIEKSNDHTNAIIYDNYSMYMGSERISLESILTDCIFQKNNDNTKIKAIIPQGRFGISGTDSLECILEKQ